MPNNYSSKRNHHSILFILLPWNNDDDDDRERSKGVLEKNVCFIVFLTCRDNRIKCKLWVFEQGILKKALILS